MPHASVDRCIFASKRTDPKSYTVRWIKYWLLQLKRELAASRVAADVREPQEVERFRFAETPFRTPPCRVSTKLDQACLVRMHRQPASPTPSRVPAHGS